MSRHYGARLASTVIPVKHTPEEFAKRYEALCKELGFQIAYEPRWGKSQDTGDFRLVIVTQIVPLETNG